MTDMVILKLANTPFTDLPWSMHTWHNFTDLDLRQSVNFTVLPDVVWYLWSHHELRTIIIDDTTIAENATLLDDMWQQRGMRCDYTDQTYSDGLLVCGIDCDVTINGVNIGWYAVQHVFLVASGV